MAKSVETSIRCVLALSPPRSRGEGREGGMGGGHNRSANTFSLCAVYGGEGGMKNFSYPHTHTSHLPPPPPPPPPIGLPLFRPRTKFFPAPLLTPKNALFVFFPACCGRTQMYRPCSKKREESGRGGSLYATKFKSATYV